jgi:hypothetical protein
MLNQEKYAIWPGLTALILGSIGLLVYSHFFKRPTSPDIPVNRAAMIEYASSKLSEETIRALYAVAEADVKRRRESREAARNALEAESAARRMRCSDPAYRARNASECVAWNSGFGGTVRPRLPAQIGVEGEIVPEPSVEELFEQRLLRECNEVTTVRVAKERGCIP